MASRTSSVESVRFRRPTCLCGYPANKSESHTSRNPNRLFYSCGSPMMSIRCGYFRWVDEIPFRGAAPEGMFEGVPVHGDVAQRLAALEAEVATLMRGQDPNRGVISNQGLIVLLLVVQLLTTLLRER